MKRLIKHKKLVWQSLLVLGVLFSSLQLAAPAYADTCSKGQEHDSQGKCCPIGEVVLPVDQGSKTTTCCPTDEINYGGLKGPIGGNASCMTSDTCSSHNTQACLITKYINPLIQLLSAAVGVVVAITIIYGAIEYTSSGSDPQRVASARKHIVSALIGLAAYLFLYTFLQFLLPGGIFNGS